MRVVVIMFAILFLNGCGSAPVGRSVVAELSSNPKTSELDFWHTLSSRPITTNDDAFHGVLLYLDGADPSLDYATRVNMLKNRGMLPKDFKGNAEEAIERGTLAVAIVKILDLKGGLTMAMFGPSPRYALRELEYRRIYPESSEQQIFSGAEFLGIIGKLEDFKEGDPANVPARVLYVGGPETPANSTQTASDDTAVQPAYLSTMASNFTLADPAAEPASQPADLKLPDGPLKLTITGVRGMAQFRVPPEESWKKAEKDQELSEGAELRTGPKSAVQIQIRPDQTVTVDRLGILKIDRATLASGKCVTAVSMPYGRTRYDIDAANREYDATVRSPNSTLGIRGTRVSLLDQRPFPPEAVSLTGTAQFRNIRRQLVALGSKNGGKVKVSGDKSSPGAFALDQAVVDPTLSGARTASEQPLVSSLLSRGAVFEIDRNLDIPVVRGGTVPQTDAELVPLLPGSRLNFVIRWNSDVDLNLGIVTPMTKDAFPATGSVQGETVYPARGLTQSPSGLKIPYDHRGGANGGIEVAYWPQQFAKGTYAVAARNQSDKSTHVRIDAYLDGKPYNNDNSLLGDLLTQANLEQGFQLVKGGYETDIPAREDRIILNDVTDESLSIQASSATKVKAKKPKAVAKPFVGPVAPRAMPARTKKP